MEAVYAMPGRTVLLYNLTADPRGPKLRAYLAGRNIRAIDVPPADDLQPLGALLGLPGFEKTGPSSPVRTFSEPMLVMFAMQGNGMSEFLQFFRSEGLSPVALKAVVTPTNVSWTSAALYHELKQEHAASVLAWCPWSPTTMPPGTSRG